MTSGWLNSVEFSGLARGTWLNYGVTTQIPRTDGQSAEVLSLLIESPPVVMDF
jgi:hypothetical protein